MPRGDDKKEFNRTLSNEDPVDPCGWDGRSCCAIPWKTIHPEDTKRKSHAGARLVSP